MNLQQLKYIVALNRFRNFARAAEACQISQPTLSAMLVKLEYENMWIIKEAQCLRNSAFSFCKVRSKGHHIYEAGSIETLIRIVDENGGFTIIPEMHLPFLSKEQRRNVRKIEGDYLSQRRISIYIREDFIRERMLNTLVDTLKMFIPEEMMGEGIRKYGIKLQDLASKSPDASRTRASHRLTHKTGNVVVVYLLIPTSNHNSHVTSLQYSQLYIF